MQDGFGYLIKGAFGWIVAVGLGTAPGQPLMAEEWVRVASFNASLHRARAGALSDDLRRGDPQARQVAAIIQRVQPDVLLINEFDWDAGGHAATIFREQYLAVPQLGQTAIDYPYVFCQPVNTGTPSAMDINANGRLGDPEDAFGYGRFPGQYGMLLLSRFPIDPRAARTFQKFLWRDMPSALVPRHPDSDSPYYPDDVIRTFRLSSKSHWDVPMAIGEHTLHVLASHPTPPVFDGPEDRNGCRNHDEIRFWCDYIDLDPLRHAYIYDDAGHRGGLAADALFVIAGDLNSDPHDGDSRHAAIVRLLTHPRVRSQPIPSSRGGIERSARQAGVNTNHQGDPAHDTSDFSDRAGSSGNLRVDYVLPSVSLGIQDSGVYWPADGEPGSDWVTCSDHRLVWVDVKLPGPTRTRGE